MIRTNRPKYYVMKKILICAVAALTLLGSCASRKLAYFPDTAKQVSGSIPTAEHSIRIQPGDELFITVTSEVPEATMVYNLPFSNPSKFGEIHPEGYATDRTQTQVTNKQQTYYVDSKGDIKFPVLGSIHVGGMTTVELADYLDKRISENVADPYVRVELVNFKIKVLGEVQTPSAFNIPGESVTVLDALAMAGDMSPYGRRDNVMVIRENNGKLDYHRLDLTSSESLSDPYFYLKQNDVVYVEPSKARASQAESQSNGYKINVVSAIVSGVSVLTSLIIALTR